MVDLNFELAKSIAASLQTIGHPYADSALKATAMDLMKWCKGGFDRDENGTAIRWTPADQALWLAEEARLTWPEGWPERGGTAKLFALFSEKFPAHRDELRAATFEELIER